MTKKQQIFWLALNGLLILIITCGIPLLIYAQHFGASWEGTEGVVTFEHLVGCDSARAYFGYDGAGPDSANFYVSLKLLPVFSNDSTILIGDGLDIDSIGLHLVKVLYWEAGSGDTNITSAVWNHYSVAELAGSGTNNVTIYAYDTANTEAVPDVLLTVEFMTGTDDAVQLTNSSGFFLFTMPTDSMVIRPYKSRYWFGAETLDVSGALTDTVYGYYTFAAPTAPISANKCTVWGFVYDQTASAEPYGEVEFSLSEHVRNTCDTVITLPHTQIAHVDDTGYFSIDLLKTSCLSPTTAKYKVVVKKEMDDGEIETRDHTFAIPDDSGTYYLVF